MAKFLDDPKIRSLWEAVKSTICRGQDYFLNVQYPKGYWWDELESNPTMEAEYVMLTHFLDTVDPERERMLVNDIRSRQREDGTWGMYYGAPGDLSTSIECYFALKLAGVPTSEPSMKMAREFILANGSVPKARVFTKIWLSLFGQWDWKGTPVMPPELILLPLWAPLNIYNFSSWARATVVPLLIILTQHPTKKIPESIQIDELYPVPIDQVDYTLQRRGSLLSWEGLFSILDKALRLCERSPFKPLRRHSIRMVEQWILKHQEADGSWGSIQPPWVYSLMALKTLGRSNDDPVIARGLQAFKENWSLYYDDSLRIQACLSPVWDTCLAMIGLLDSGMAPSNPSLQRAALWLLQKEIRVAGDWAVKVKDVEPSGWAFEFENALYPDIDDTSIILMALDRVNLSAEDEVWKREALQRGIDWLLAMQSSNGGWASFDKDNNNRLVAKLPFSDFGEMLDPPSVDVTAHVVEALGHLGYSRYTPAIQHALDYIMREQEEDGSWFGRWGVNCIYGTGAVLPALQTIGEDMSQPYIENAVNWLLGKQNPDGGWGESCASYVDTSLRGRGESTPSQTSWALISLIAAGLVDHQATTSGIRYLVETQRGNGTWDEPQFTGCGFPGYGIGDQPDKHAQQDHFTKQGSELSAGFLINYHMYRNYFPLWALGRYYTACQEINSSTF
jgi:squalene-hopene/tetraprenyl-beta-curcumene cyclase